jgi:hypothetical protein
MGQLHQAELTLLARRQSLSPLGAWTGWQGRQNVVVGHWSPSPLLDRSIRWVKCVRWGSGLWPLVCGLWSVARGLLAVGCGLLGVGFTIPGLSVILFWGG